MTARHEPDRDAMRAALGRFLAGETVHEIRILNVDERKRIDSGYFNDPDKAAAALAAYTGERADGIYITVNPVNPALLSRAANRLQPYAKHATGDNDIPGYRRLFIDVDSTRPAGICATNEERAAAIARARSIAAFLGDQGWPAPQMAITSGNGAYLVYGLELPNDPESRRLVDGALTALGALFTGDVVKVDTSVGNPSRIMRLPGTWNAKGDDTPERPWRLATARYRDDAPAVTGDQLARLAAQAPEPERAPRSITAAAGTGRRGWDIRDVLRNSAIAYREKEKPYGTVYALEGICLTSDDHTDGATIIEVTQGGNAGMLLYSCRHDRCQGKTWHDAKRHPRLRIPEPAAPASTPAGSSGAAGQPAPAAASPAPRVAIVRSLADVESKPIEWLWTRWLPARMLALLGGYPGDGKSTLLAWLIATFSRGGWLPDGSRAPVLNSLLLAGEDDPEYAIRPRLDRHRADLTRIDLLEGTQQGSGERKWFDLQRDCDVMREVIEAHDIRLVVIDPLSSYLSKSDRNSEGDVRDALAPLLTLMQDTGAAVIGVMHVGKATGRRPMQSLMGSTAFPAIARTTWMVHDLPKEHQDTPTDNEPNPPKKKVLGVDKCNYSLRPKALAFSIPLDGAVTFHGESPVTLEEAFAGDGAGSKKGDAEEWLADYLKGGSRMAREVEQAAKDAGHSEGTLRRAREALKVETRKGREPNAPWYWSLPTGAAATPQMSTLHNEQSPESIEDAHVSALSAFPENREKLAGGGGVRDTAASGGESKVLKDAYIDNLSTFHNVQPDTPARQCCEPGCSEPIAPGGRYYCAQHRPGAA